MTSKAPYRWMFKRDHKSFPFQILQNDGTPYDLTSVTEITFTVREKNTETATVIFTCTKTGGDIVVTAATDGKIRVDVEPTDTSSATAGSKVYDVEIQDSASQDHTCGKGKFDIIQDITHS